MGKKRIGTENLGILHHWYNILELIVAEILTKTSIIPTKLATRPGKGPKGRHE